MEEQRYTQSHTACLGTATLGTQLRISLTQMHKKTLQSFPSRHCHNGKNQKLEALVAKHFNKMYYSHLTH
jgi:hypothetical protein